MAKKMESNQQIRGSILMAILNRGKSQRHKKQWAVKSRTSPIQKTCLESAPRIPSMAHII